MLVLKSKRPTNVLLRKDKDRTVIYMVCSVHRICVMHLCRLTYIYQQYKRYTRRTAATSYFHTINNDISWTWPVCERHERYKLYQLYRHIFPLIDAIWWFTSQYIHHMEITMVHESSVQSRFLCSWLQSLYFVSISCQKTSALGHLARRNHWRNQAPWNLNDLTE